MRYNYAIELGGASTTIFAREEGFVLKEPTLVAVETSTEGYKVKAVGEEAKKLVWKTLDEVEVFNPIANGVIENFEYTLIMLSCFLKKIKYKKASNILVLIPCGLTGEEKKKYYELFDKLGFNEISLIPAVLCSLLGCNVNILSPKASMIVDIGGATTDIAVVNLGSILKGVTLGIGGRAMDIALANSLAMAKDGILIGLPTAEKVKNEIGSLYKNDTLNMEVMGLDGASNMPKTKIISCRDIRHVFEAFLEEIVRTINVTINTLPPEISADIIKNGVIFTGGVSKITGLDDFLKRTLTYNFTISDDGENVAILGAGKLLNDEALLKKVLA